MINYLIIISLVGFSSGAVSQLPLQTPEVNVPEPPTLETLQANLSALWTAVINIERLLREHTSSPIWVPQHPSGQNLSDVKYDYEPYGHTGKDLYHHHAGEPLIGAGQHDYVHHDHAGHEESNLLHNSTDAEGSGDGQVELNTTQSTDHEHPPYVDHNGRRYYLGLVPIETLGPIITPIQSIPKGPDGQTQEGNLNQENEEGTFANVSAHDLHRRPSVYVPSFYGHHYYPHVHSNPQQQGEVGQVEGQKEAGEGEVHGHGTNYGHSHYGHGHGHGSGHGHYYSHGHGHGHTPSFAQNSHQPSGGQHQEGEVENQQQAETSGHARNYGSSHSHGYHQDGQKSEGEGQGEGQRYNHGHSQGGGHGHSHGHSHREGHGYEHGQNENGEGEGHASSYGGYGGRGYYHNNRGIFARRRPQYGYQEGGGEEGEFGEGREFGEEGQYGEGREYGEGQEHGEGHEYGEGQEHGEGQEFESEQENNSE